MPTEKQRFTITVPDDMFDRINDYRFENRYGSLTQAVLKLIELGLDIVEQQKKET